MKTPTMSDIARATGVSKNTVSLALRNDPQIPKKTRARIRGAAERLGYRKDPVVAQLMARLRKGGSEKPRATLALLNANHDRDAFKRHPTIPTYIEGCKRRANHLGYGLDSFWLHDPELDGHSLNRILKARGIRGVVVVGLMKSNRLPSGFDEIWNNYPCVVTGVRTRKPALSFACADHHIILLRGFEKALELGYQRPGLVLDGVIDDLVEGRFTAGYRIAQEMLPQKRRLKPLYDLAAAHADPRVFQSWMEKEKPDVIFTLYNVVRYWLEALHFRIPEDIGLIQMEWRAAEPEWAGMNQHNDLTGEAAVDMVVSMIHSGEFGVPPFPRATLIGSSWVDGKTANLLAQPLLLAGHASHLNA